MADVTSPFCWQIHRPWIVVPEFLLRSHPDCVKYILRHELAHLRTGHPLQMFLQRTVELLFWFHPAVWRMSREIELVRESLCDRASVHSRSEISEYLRTLLTIAERQTGDSVSTSSPLGFLRGRSMMAERIRRLIQLAEQSGAPVRSWPAATTAASTLLIAAAASVALLRIPLSGPPSAELGWSCWPAWSAAVLHDLGMPVRDFERLGYQYTVQELREREQRGSPGTAAERLGMPRIRDP